MRSSCADTRIVPLGHYMDGRRYYAEAALKAARADICHVQFNYLYFNGELPYKNRFLYFAGRVGIPLVMTVHEAHIGFRPLAAGFSSRVSMAAYNALLPVLNRWSVAFHTRMYARAGRIIVHTSDHAKAVRALTKEPDKVVLMPHGIPDISEADRSVSGLEAKKRLGLEGKRAIDGEALHTRRELERRQEGALCVVFQLRREAKECHDAVSAGEPCNSYRPQPRARLQQLDNRP